MSGAINFGLLNPDIAGNASAAFVNGMKMGRDMRNERLQREALSQYQANPSNAINALMPVNPALALKLSEEQRSIAETNQKAAFGQAATGYVQNAFAPRNVPMNALSPMADTRPAAGMAQGGMVANPTASPTPQQPKTDPADEQFLKMVQIDPVAAFKIQSAARDNALKRLKAVDDAYSFAVEQLANVSDDQAYQQVLQGMDARLQPLGVDIRSMVPAQYPGPDGVRQLLMKAMNAQQQLSAIDRRDRQEWDIQDDKTDNARADTEAASRADDRSRRAGIAASREQRLANPPARPAKAAKGGKKQKRPTASDGKGNTVEWDGKAWVPVN